MDTERSFAQQVAARVERVCREHPVLRGHEDWLAHAAAPALLLLEAREGARSHLVGNPSLPESLRWPEIDGVPYQFILSLDLGDVAAAARTAPEGFDLPEGPGSGTLLLWVSPPEAELDPGDPRRLVAHLVPDGVPVAEASIPPREWFEPQPAAPVRLVPGPVRRISAFDEMSEDEIAALPDPPSAPPGASPEEDDALWEEASEARSTAYGDNARWILGPPCWNTLAYDPTPDGDWLCLLTIYSDNDLDLFFADYDWFMVFIEREAFARGDFTNLRTDEG